MGKKLIGHLPMSVIKWVRMASLNGMTVGKILTPKHYLLGLCFITLVGSRPGAKGGCGGCVIPLGLFQCVCP